MFGVKLNWAMWSIIILAVIGGGEWLWIVHQNNQIDDLRLSVKTYADTQKTNLESISALETRARELVAQNAAKESEASAAAERNKRMFDALNDELKKRQTVREKVYVSDKSAAAWADGVVPAAVADSLR